MKKRLLSVALILTMVLTLTLFTRNKAGAYYGGPYGGYGTYGDSFCGYNTYGGYGTYSDSFSGYSMIGDSYSGYSGYSMYGSLYGGYGNYGGQTFGTVGTGGGKIFFPERVNEPSPPESPPSGDGSSGSNSTKKKQYPESSNIFPPFMPIPEFVPITYPISPVETDYLWYDFQVMPPLFPMFPTMPVHLPDTYWPTDWPMQSPTFPNNLPIPEW